MRAVAVLAKYVAGPAERVLALEVIADDADADGAAGLELGVAQGNAIGLGKRAGDDLGRGRRRPVGHRLLGQRPVDNGEGRSAEATGQRVRIILQAGGDRRGARRSHHQLFLVGVPAAHVDGAHLLGRRHPWTELDQVVAEDELQGVAVALVVPVLRSVGSLDGLAEIEVAVVHPHLVTDLAGARLDEVPVGLVRLRDMVVGDAGGIDLAKGEVRIAGHLADDVGIGDILIGLGVATAMQAMGKVVAAENRAQAGGVVLRLESGDLALDQCLGRSAGRRHLDADGRSDVDVQLADHVPSRIAEGDGEHRRQMLVMVHNHLLEEGLAWPRQGRPIDLEVGPEMIGLRHFSSCCWPPLRRCSAAGSESRSLTAAGHRCR